MKFCSIRNIIRSKQNIVKQDKIEDEDLLELRNQRTRKGGYIPQIRWFRDSGGAEIETAEHVQRRDAGRVGRMLEMQQG